MLHQAFIGIIKYESLLQDSSMRAIQQWTWIHFHFPALYCLSLCLQAYPACPCGFQHCKKVKYLGSIKQTKTAQMFSVTQTLRPPRGKRMSLPPLGELGYISCIFNNIRDENTRLDQLISKTFLVCFSKNARRGKEVRLYILLTLG